MTIKIITNLDKSRWEEYKNLRIQALEDVPQAFLDDPNNARKQGSEFWQKRLKGMIFAELDGKLIGMIGTYKEDKKKLEHIANIVGVYVVPGSRGKKVGHQLFASMLDRLKKDLELKKAQLGVVTTQESALRLYESFGFKQVGHVRYAVKVGDTYYDEYLMEKYF